MISTAPSQPARRAASLSVVIGLPVCVPSGDHPVTMRDHPFNPDAAAATRSQRPVDTVPHRGLTERIRTLTRGPPDCNLLQWALTTAGVTRPQGRGVEEDEATTERQ
ncbi:hypothetical protein GCM10009743_33270 [Kribbella swartbergensis]